jgi:hypothetical protein
MDAFSVFFASKLGHFIAFTLFCNAKNTQAYNLKPLNPEVEIKFTFTIT